MVDIRTIIGENKQDAITKARIEYGTNFIILSDKEVKVGGFLGFRTKTKVELRIMLNNSIYSNKRNEVKNSFKEDDYVYEGRETDENKLISDRIEMDKHKPQTDTIDASEMGNRIVEIANKIKAAKNNNKALNSSLNSVKVMETPSPIVEEKSGGVNLDTNNKSEFFFNGGGGSYNSSFVGSNLLSDSYNSKNAIDESVKKIVRDQVKDIVKEYLERNVPSVHKNYNNDFYSGDFYNDNGGREGKARRRYEFRSEENNIRSAINDIKSYREDINSARERRDYNDYSNSDTYDKYAEDDLDCNLDNADAMEESFNYLRDREFPEEILSGLKEYLLNSSNARFFQSKDIIREEIEKYFSKKLILANGIDLGTKKKIIVFVGPTGVGKTTTIPKIAAQYMKSGRKVAFVTIDNYRIAAVDQLQRYASIMKVPFTSASTPEALRGEIRKMDNSSLLFIDTMGRSPNGMEDIVSMSKYFGTVGRFDMDVQLVMSSTAKYKDSVKILNAFKPTNYKGIILTKVDETDYLASSVCAISKTKTPITYVTYGQGVPKDITTAKKYGGNIIESLYGYLK